MLIHSIHHYTTVGVAVQFSALFVSVYLLCYNARNLNCRQKTGVRITCEGRVSLFL